MILRGISEAAHGSAKISNLGQNRISANMLWTLALLLFGRQTVIFSEFL